MLDVGTYSSKRVSDTSIIDLVRQVIKGMPNADPHEVIDEAIRLTLLHEDKELLELAAMRYAYNNIYQRFRPKPLRSRSGPTSSEIAAVMKISASIRLWDWKMPVSGKKLHECTFSELADEARYGSRFLTLLAREGAPGTQVSEVFKTETELQDFWKKNV